MEPARAIVTEPINEMVPVGRGHFLAGGLTDWHMWQMIGSMFCTVHTITGAYDGVTNTDGLLYLCPDRPCNVMDTVDMIKI